MDDIHNLELNTRTITKGVVSLVVSACAASVVKQVIKHNIDTPPTRRGALVLWVGSGGIAGVASYYVGRNVERQIDEVYEAIDRGIAKADDPTN